MLDRLNIKIDESTRRMLLRLGWGALLFTIAFVVVSAVERKERSKILEPKIDIQPLEAGESLLTETEVLLAIQRNLGYELNGRALASVDVERVEEVLETESFILDADVYITANNQVRIKIIQREPILRVIDNNGMNYYLDINGMKMPPSKHFTAKVLVVTGSLPAYDINFRERKRNRLKDAFELAQYILDDNFLNPMIEQFHFSTQGKITLVPKVGNHKIHFGKYELAEDKIRRLKAFYKEAIPHEGWQKYATVNLEYKGQVVCEKR
jgi:cell division protein FtsQ